MCCFSIFIFKFSVTYQKTVSDRYQIRVVRCTCKPGKGHTLTRWQIHFDSVILFEKERKGKDLLFLLILTIGMHINRSEKTHLTNTKIFHIRQYINNRQQMSVSCINNVFDRSLAVMMILI